MATLAKWKGKEDALFATMEAHEAGERSLVHGVLTTGDMEWLKSAFKNYTGAWRLERGV